MLDHQEALPVLWPALSRSDGSEFCSLLRVDDNMTTCLIIGITVQMRTDRVAFGDTVWPIIEDVPAPCDNLGFG